MAITYQLRIEPAEWGVETPHADDKIACIIKKDSTRGMNVLQIPQDESNMDYQEYLAWVADGNTAEAGERYDADGNVV